jgi:hypothetical protein
MSFIRRKINMHKKVNIIKEDKNHRIAEETVRKFPADSEIPEPFFSFTLFWPSPMEDNHPQFWANSLLS